MLLYTLLILFAIFCSLILCKFPRKNTITLYDNYIKDVFCRYVIMNKSMFNLHSTNIKCGSMNTQYKNELEYEKLYSFRNNKYYYLDDNNFISLVNSKKTYFNDTIFNMRGYIIWKKDYITIYCDNLDSTYIENILKFMNKKEEKVVYCKFFNYKHYGNYDPQYQISHKNNNLYFHTIQSRLVWNYLKKVQFEPEFFTNKGQIAKANILIKGLSGCGKSYFINRLEKFKRHILIPNINELFINVSNAELVWSGRRNILEINKYSFFFNTQFFPFEKKRNHCGFSICDHLLSKNLIIVFENIDTYIKKIEELDMLDCLSLLLSTYAEQSIIVATITPNKYDEIIANPIIKNILNKFMILDLEMDLQQFITLCKTFFNQESNLFEYAKNIPINKLTNKATKLCIKYESNYAFKQFEKFIYKKIDK